MGGRVRKPPFMIPRGVLCWRTNAWDKYSFKCIKNNFRNSIRKYIGNDIRNSIRKCSETLSGDVSESQSETISPSTSINLPKTTSYLSLPLFPFPLNHNLIKIPTRPQHPKRLFDHPFISGGVEYDSFVLKPVFQNVF